MNPCCKKWKLLLLLFGLLPICAIESKAQTPEHQLDFSLWNDNWGGNVTQVYDDYRTLAFELAYQRKNRWGILARFSQLSTRYEKDSLRRQATDEWVIQGNYALLPYSEEKRFAFDVLGGVIYVGSQAGQKLQSFTHETFGVAPSNLIPSTEKHLFLSLGYRMNYALLKQYPLLNNQFRVSLAHQLTYTPGYTFITDIGVRLELKNDYHRLRFTPGYVFANTFNPDLFVSNTVTEAESGISLDVEFQAQRFFYHLKVFPQQNYCEGGIGLRLLQFKAKDTRENTEKFAVNVLGDGLGYDFTFGSKARYIKSFPYRYILQYQFNSYLKKYFPLSPDIKAHGNSLTGGMELDLLKDNPKRWITPYASLTAGFKHIAVYSKVLPLDLQRSWHLTANQDLGIRWNIPMPAKLSQKRLQLLMFQRLIFQYSLSPDSESTLINPDSSPYRAFLKTYGIGARFNI